MNTITKLSRLAGVFLVVLIGAASLTSTAQAADQGGSWTKRYQKIHGTWQIVETEEGRFLELDDDFKTRRAPDLKLFLSPRIDGDVTPDNAVAGSILISKLKKAKGAQRYALPADLDLDNFQTLILHCEQYTKLWGVSPLR